MTFDECLAVTGSAQTGRLRDQNMPAELAELYASIYCRLADCYVLTGQLDRAVVTYERTLPYFQLAASGGTTSRRRLLLELNTHALSMLATVNFLLHNFWRAAVIYETAMMLDHQLHADDSKQQVSHVILMNDYDSEVRAERADYMYYLFRERCFECHCSYLDI